MQISDYIKRTADLMGVTPELIIGTARDEIAVNARRVVIKVARERLGRSWSDIGRAVNRDRTAVSAAYRAANTMADNNAYFARVVEMVSR